MSKILLYFMVLLYVAAGVNHFIHPQPYIAIIPAWLPYPSALVFISGVCEIGLGLLLLPVATRRFAAWGIIAMLILIFPANIQMAINYYREGNPFFWVTIVRLPLQVLLILWAYRYTRRKQY